MQALPGEEDVFISKTDFTNSNSLGKIQIRKEKLISTEMHVSGSPAPKHMYSGGPHAVLPGVL